MTTVSDQFEPVWNGLSGLVFISFCFWKKAELVLPQLGWTWLCLGSNEWLKLFFCPKMEIIYIYYISHCSLTAFKGLMGVFPLPPPLHVPRQAPVASRAGIFFISLLFILLINIYIDYTCGQQQ